MSPDERGPRATAAAPTPARPARRPRKPWPVRRGAFRARRRRVVVKRLLPVFVVALALLAGFFLPWERLLYPLRFTEQLKTHALTFGLKPSLVAAVVLHESEFAHDAHSAAGARGLMQLMPTTASWMANLQGYRQVGLADLEDPAVSLYLGCAYLRHLRERFHGNLVATLAAYNAGPGQVEEWQERPESLEVGRIPFPETRHYVRQVLRSQLRYSALYPELDD